MQQQLEITTPVLSYISKVLTRGQPLLAQAIANEYLPKNSGLRKAIAIKVVNSASESCNKGLLKQLCVEGLKIGEIKDEIYFEKPTGVSIRPIVAIRKSWRSAGRSGL